MSNGGTDGSKRGEFWLMKKKGEKGVIEVVIETNKRWNNYQSEGRIWIQGRNGIKRQWQRWRVRWRSKRGCERKTEVLYWEDVIQEQCKAWCSVFRCRVLSWSPGWRVIWGAFIHQLEHTVRRDKPSNLANTHTHHPGRCHQCWSLVKLSQQTSA